MLSSQLFWRICCVYAVLIIVSVVAVIAIVSTGQREVSLHEAQLRLTGMTSLLIADAETALKTGETSEFERIASRAAAENGIRFDLLGPDGEIISGKAADRPQFDDAVDLSRAREFGRGLYTVYARSAAGPQMHVSNRLGDAGRPIGYLRGSLSLNPVLERLDPTWRRIWVTAAIISALGTGITYLVVAQIIRPLEQLTVAVRKMSQGHSAPQVHVRTGNELGTLAAAFNSMSDQLTQRIAELQHKQSELERNNEQLATVLGSMVEGVVAVDADERVLLANSAALQMLDLEREQAIGRPVWEALRHASFHQVLHDAFSGKPLRRFEIELPRSHSTVAILTSRLPGTPCPGIVLVLHDITDLRRLEAMRREFVANVSHELKTPLAAIQAYVETLLDGALEDTECSERFVRRIEEQSERLHKLILDLLRLQRIESDQVTFDVGPVRLEQVVTAAVDEHQAVATSNGLTLHLHPGPPIRVLADEDGLRTVIDNLLDNALNYTDAGGSVHVRWYGDDQGVRLEVQDTGTGIPQDQLARIFERFHRVDRARSRERGGTGLGLSIVKHLCQMFGGSIRVDSRLGTGSTFIVRLNAANTGDSPPETGGAMKTT